MIDNHAKHVVDHNRQWGKTKVRGLLLILKEAMTVTDWQNEKEISKDDMLAYPNARTAYDIMQSPLYKALL